MGKITAIQAKEIRNRYLAGQKLSHIAKDMGVSSTSVTKAINDEHYGLSKLDIPEEQITLFEEMKIENDAIKETKEDMMAFIKAAIVEGMESNTKLLFLDKVINAMNTLDRIQRLNKGEATDRQEVVTKHVDYAEVMKELKTPDDKFAFLKAQLEKGQGKDKEEKVIDIN